MGDDGNSGLDPATPKLTIQNLVDTYDLEGGDTVYVDTGSYPSAGDIELIWSRSGESSAPVTIQGNTNGFLSMLTRTGSTNYPAVGVNIKASDVQLRNLGVRGINRGILLDSNRNTTVSGVAVIEAETGIVAAGAQDLEVRNSALWKTGTGIQLLNTRTSVLENNTFALSALVGVQLTNSSVDTLRNNVFIPGESAYAYSIGTATSLLEDAVMDYNLYDLSAAGSGIIDGFTNDIRRWQLQIGHDYRSAITNADLVETDYPGDLHPRSEYGRWTDSGWTLDATTSWAVDRGDPDADYAEEPEDNGERLNIGMYGNTVQASKGSTNVYYELRVLNDDGIVIRQDDLLWPLTWSAHLIDDLETVLVQFSGDGGISWATLDTVSAYQEYYLWQIGVDNQTENGRWRVIGVTDTNELAESQYDFRVRFAELGFLTRPYPVSGLMRFDWEGGIQGKRYVIKYSDDFGQTWQEWSPKYNGPARINMSNFIIPVGESQISYTFEDRTSYLKRQRWYRLYEFEE